MTRLDNSVDDRAPDGLTFPYCDECEQWRIAGRHFCALHPDRPLTLRRLSGRGTVYSYIVSHTAMSPDVAENVPYTTVLVATAEGPRILAHGGDAANLHIGDPVEIVEATDTQRALLPGSGLRIAHPTRKGARG